MLIPRFAVGMFSVGMMVLGGGTACGQEYPNKPIRIVTAPAGGGSDFIARLVSQGIAGPLGQPMIVDNRTSLLGAEFVSKAPPDGYTLLVSGGNLWIGPLLRKVPYDFVKDFSPITLISREVLVLVVHPSLPVKSVKELIALARARPGELNYASGSIGGTAHLSAELFRSMAGVDIMHIPYKGTDVTALASGEVQMTIADAGSVTPYVKSGRFRALAVTSAEPSPLVPGLPTVAASGVPGYESVSMTGIFASGKTPQAIINRLNQEIVQFLNRSDVKVRFLDARLEAVGNSPEQFAATLKSEVARWSKVIKDAGIKVE